MSKKPKNGGKMPSFQFYPSDWRRDPALAAVGHEAKGVWIDLLCIMHECENRGVLAANNRKLSSKVLANMVGISTRKFENIVQKLIDYGVCSIDEETGAICSARMMRDEQIRKAHALAGAKGAEFGHLGAAHGAKGGRPKNPPNNPPLETPLKPPPSSSSSSILLDTGTPLDTFLHPSQNPKSGSRPPACLSSETYVSPSTHDDRAEGGQAGASNSLDKDLGEDEEASNAIPAHQIAQNRSHYPPEGGDSGEAQTPAQNRNESETRGNAPMTREGWLKLAERIEIPTAFAKALWEEMEEQDWIASDGVRVVSAAKFLRAAWLRETSKTSTQSGGDRREAWQIERDIERIKKEIKRITSDKASYNHNKQGPSLAEHKLKFEDQWLAYLARMERGGKAKLGADYAEFLREHEEHVRQLIADGVPASTMGDEYRLARFAERFKDEADLTFEDWDRTLNKANRWLNPEELKPEIKVQIREMKAVISRLESEKMEAIAG